MEHDPLDMEYWYPYLSSFTFATVFVDLHADEAQAIVDRYDDIKYGSEKSNQPLLLRVATKIDEAIQSFGTNKAFVKLSTRSAKDVVIRDPRTKNRIKEEIEQINQNIPLEQKEVVAIIRTCSKSMQVSTGSEAVEMLCKSERAYQDLFRRLLTAETFSMKIVVREWVDIIPEYEFRGFVHKKSFNALTQYYKACYVPEIVQQKQKIEEMINNLFQQYQPEIDKEGKIESYVADFAFDADFNHVYLVELNHWGTTASSSLFDWAKDTDVMHKGPFEMRTVDKPIKNVKLMMAGPLRIIMGEINESWNAENIAKLQEAQQREEEETNKKCCIQ